MISFLFNFAISNLVLSVPLALVAYAVHRSQRSPALAHLLWVLVLAKLVTPPIFSISVVPLPSISPPVASASTHEIATQFSVATDIGNVETSSPMDTALSMPSVDSKDSWIAVPVVGVFVLWIGGSLFVFVHSIKSVLRFHRRLQNACFPVEPELQRLAIEASEQLGLGSCPQVYSVQAEISPLVWWIGGQARVILPDKVRRKLPLQEVKLILAHELAHIKRRDHWVRWLEWLACVVFWWNPLAWWARRCLRVNEELCCDAMVLKALDASPQRYGLLLLQVVEFLSSPDIRPPAEACAINSGGSLERRFRMIVSMNTLNTMPRWLSGGMLALAIGVLPFGIAYGQDFEAVERRLGAAVADGEINLSQAQTMLNALRETSKGNELDQLKADIEREIRHVGEDLRRQHAAGQINQHEMEANFRSAEQEMWKHYREAEMEHRARNYDEYRAHSDHDHEHGDHEHGNHEHGDHEHGDHEHGNHEHGDHEHGDHDHGDHEHGDHEHGDHEHGNHDHGNHEHGDHEHGDHEHGEDSELDRYKARIDEEMQRMAEAFHNRFAEGEFNPKVMEEEFRALESKLREEYREAELKHRGREDDQNQQQDHDASREAYMNHVRGIEQAIKSGEMSHAEGMQNLEETKRKMDRESKKQKVQVDFQIIFNLEPNGEVIFEGTRHEIDSLDPVFRQQIRVADRQGVEGPDEITVLIRADEDTEANLVQKLIAKCTEHKLQHIALQAK